MMDRRLTLVYVLALLCLLALMSALPAGAGLPSHPANRTGNQVELGDAVPPKLAPSAWAKIEPLVLKELDQQGTTTFIVYLTARADLKPLQRMKAGAPRRQAVVQALQTTAQESQRDVRAFLDRQRAAGHVTDYLPFWVFNGLAVTGDAETLYALAARPDVAKIRANHVRRLPEPDFAPDDTPAQAPVVWNVERIRAPQAWQEFGITGKGVVVGSMDTGVQWTHPALSRQYRGADGDHNYNWFDVTGTYPTAPGDGHGHGTHTTGTAVGDDATARGSEGGGTERIGERVGASQGDENRIGVAPGAQWIAVKVFTDSGTATDVDLHRAFQWMLAPTDLNGENPDPARAPDVVNNSWGSSYPDADPSFWPDVASWRAAGIFSSFSAGNEGDLGDGSVGTPGSLPISFSVGATDADEHIAGFSSRGPSFWNEIKPNVSAPGVSVRSSVPTDSYATASGTSMSAPHVTGLAALLLEANPDLTVDELEEFIRRTAVDRGPAGPDNSFGWGRIDAYQAVRWALSAGWLNGTVRDAESNAPLPGASVAGLRQNEPTDALTVQADAGGVYTVSVPAGVYTVTASAFGYLPASVDGVEVITGFLSVHDLVLKPAPTGTLAGRVSETRTGRPLAATVGVPGTPASTITDAEGRYTLVLPTGAHTVTVAAPAHRQVATPVSIAEGETQVLDVELEPVPSILLVDADTWVGTNQTLYYRRALDELGYSYDVHLIADTADDVPTAAELAAYDVVVWVHPWSSPGYIDDRERGDTATVDALRAYLDGGGRLFIIGQDIGYWDSGQGPSTAQLAPAFYAEYLNAVYLGDSAGSRSLTGVPDEFLSGVQLRLEDVYGYKWGSDLAPDYVEPATSRAVPILTYENSRIGGLRVSGGAYRLVYLPFGLEGAGPRSGFTETISRTLAWLGQPTFTKSVDQPVVAPGATLTYTLQVVNPLSLNLTGLTLFDPLPAEVSFVPGSVTGGATYDDTANAIRWSGDLAPRQALTATFQATVASPLQGGTVITNQATLDDGRGGLLTATVTTTVVGPDLSPSRKVVSHATADPGEVLTYTLTLTNLATAPVPDVQLVDPIPAGTRYVTDSVTGGATYDPVANQVQWTGTVPGREQVTPDYTWRDSDTPGGPAFEWVDISTSGVPIEGLGDDTNVGPFPIGFAFPFYGQTFTSFRVCSNGWLSFDSTSTTYNNRRLPATDAPGNLVAPFWDDLTLVTAGRVLYWTNPGLTARTGNVDTLVVTYEDVPRFGNQGPYTFQVILRADGSITYQYLSMGTPTDSATIGVQNADGTQGLTIAHNQTYLHDGLAILITPPVPPPPPPQITFRVQIEPGLQGHSSIVNRAVVTDSAGVSYTLAARTLVRPADLSASNKVVEPQMAAPGDTVTYTITLRNPTAQTAPAVTASDPLPAEVDLVPGSLTGGAAYDPAARLVTWTGPVPAGEEHVISFAARLKPTAPVGTSFTNTATIDDGLHPPFTRSAGVAVGLPDLSRSRKAVDRAVARSGDELRYTISLTNTGQLAATGLTLVDPIPEGATYVPDSVTGGAAYDPAANAIRWQGDVPARGLFTWRDSTMPGGPGFDWMDITAIGTEITELGDDVNVGPLPIGFKFPFFGQRFAEFYFSTNGFLSFSPIVGSNYTNQRLPNPDVPGNMLAVFWDDLDFRYQGRAYYWSNGTDTLVVSYVDVPHLSSGGPYTFQAILKSDGTITYQYLTMESRLDEATIGLQNADGTEGLTVVYNAPYVADRLAIRFLPPRWQTVSFRVAINPDLPMDTMITNTATVDGWWGPLALTTSTQVNTVDLGASRLEVSQKTAQPGDRLTYTMHVINDGVVPTEARVSIPVPDQTTYVAGSVTGGAVYDLATNRVTWAGTVPSGPETTFAFAVVTDPTLPNGARIQATATVEDGIHPAFTRGAETRIVAPDFSGSQKIADRARADIGDLINYTIVVENSGDVEATATVTDVLPATLEYVPDSASAGSGSPPGYDPAARQLTWQGTMPARSRTTLSFAGRVTEYGPIVNRALINDGRGVVVEREARTESAAVMAVIPAARGVTGYVTSKNRLGNYLGQRAMYTGVDDRPQRPAVFHGVVQFDLSSIPADAVLIGAQVELTGLDGKFMGADAQGRWNLRLLDSQVDLRWMELGYWHVHHTAVAETLSPTLGDEDLGPGRVNVFTFGPAQLSVLAERMQTTGRASFRLDGMAARPHQRHIFAWDAQAPPVLRVIYRR